jgi:hypothetical protein
LAWYAGVARNIPKGAMMQAQEPIVKVGTKLDERTRVTKILNDGVMVNVKGQIETKWTFQEIERKLEK